MEDPDNVVDFEHQKTLRDCDRIFGWIATAFERRQLCTCGPADYDDQPHEKGCPLSADPSA